MAIFNNPLEDKTQPKQRTLFPNDDTLHPASEEVVYDCLQTMRYLF